jgi:hypothetical protein
MIRGAAARICQFLTLANEKDTCWSLLVLVRKYQHTLIIVYQDGMYLVVSNLSWKAFPGHAH